VQLFSSPYVTSGHEFVLIPYEIFRISCFEEFSLPLISNIPMLKIAKMPVWINGQIFFESDGHDHLLE
jgi:hypothetical protein